MARNVSVARSDDRQTDSLKGPTCVKLVNTDVEITRCDDTTSASVAHGPKTDQEVNVELFDPMPT